MAMRRAFLNRLTMYEHGVAGSSRGLVAQWKFEQGSNGMVPDSSGNNLYGRLVGDAKVYADPDRGNVLSLDGDGDWVDCGADWRFDITGEITISAWIKVGRFDKDWQAIITKGDGSAVWWRLHRIPATNTLYFNRGGDRIPGMQLNLDPFPRTKVNDGKWHHVTCVYDGRRERMYIDGKLDASKPVLAFSRINAPAGSVLIGNWAGARREWNGLIDDVRIYSYALTPQDIKALHEDKGPAENKASTK
jgi:hypothetical protein